MHEQLGVQLGVSSNCKLSPIHVDRMDMVDSVTYVLVRAYVTVRYHATLSLTLSPEKSLSQNECSFFLDPERLL
jgi:hypothetical protein